MMLILLTAAAVLQAAPAVPTNADTFVAEVRTLAAAESNEARFDVLAAMLRARGLPFTVERFTIDQPLRSEPRTEGRNILLTLGDGRDHLVVGAHYDAARLADGSLSRGAVDNGASAVMLVHLAERLRREALPMRVTIAWFDMEELGLVGSGRYLDAHEPGGITAMLNFDINAYGDTLIYGPSRREDNLPLRQAFLQTCAAEDVACVGFPQMPPSDDRSFTARGVPALSVAVLPAVEAHQAWLMMNAGEQSGLARDTVPAILRTIHTAADTIEKVEGQTIERVLRFAESLVRHVTERRRGAQQ